MPTLPIDEERKEAWTTKCTRLDTTRHATLGGEKKGKKKKVKGRWKSLFPCCELMHIRKFCLCGMELTVLSPSHTRRLCEFLTNESAHAHFDQRKITCRSTLYCVCCAWSNARTCCLYAPSSVLNWPMGERGTGGGGAPYDVHGHSLGVHVGASVAAKASNRS